MKHKPITTLGFSFLFLVCACAMRPMCNRAASEDPGLLLVDLSQPQTVEHFLAGDHVLVIAKPDGDNDNTLLVLHRGGNLRVQPIGMACDWLGQGNWEVQGDHLEINATERVSTNCAPQDRGAPSYRERTRRFSVTQLQCRGTDYCRGTATQGLNARVLDVVGREMQERDLR